MDGARWLHRRFLCLPENALHRAIQISRRYIIRPDSGKIALAITEISKVLTAQLGIQNEQSRLINHF